MTLSEVTTHSDHYVAHPALNVKLYRFPGADDIRKRCHIPAHLSERIAEWAYEDAIRDFWEQAAQNVAEIFGPHATCVSEGRSGGWLTVHGLGPIDDWDEDDLAKWAELQRLTTAAIKDIGSPNWYQALAETIESNRWNEDGAEHYNFIDRRNGESVCMVDLKWGLVPCW